MSNRPLYHFTPKKGWINDPNGCVFADGVYHLFFQYYPDEPIWGPMYWGHAQSRDLLSWDEKEIALCPDRLGYIFSGSAVIDKDNLSGFGGEKPRMIAMYTSHNPKTGEQQQSIAYSTDYIHFTKYENNPVIPNVLGTDGYRPDCRDPKMFADKVRGGYSAVLSGGDRILFYHTDDFIHWEKSGEFAPEKKIIDGIYECPDLIRFDTPDGEKYVLIDSVVTENSKNLPFGVIKGHPMQYFVGSWDGYSFTAEEGENEVLIPDWGTDNYAMVSFAGVDKPLFIGWAENWGYVKTTPCRDYRGKMTTPRYADLVKTENGYRLKFTPAAEFCKKSYDLKVGETVTVENGGQPAFTLTVGEKYIHLDRKISPIAQKTDLLAQDEAYTKMHAKREKCGDCHIDMYFDRGVVEIFADDGFEVMTVSTDVFE